MERSWSRSVWQRRLRGSRNSILLRAALLIAVIAIVDWRFDVNISFGFLYLFPMLMIGGRLSLWQIALVAAVCTGLSEAFDPFPWSAEVGIPRLVLTFSAFFGAGLYVHESTRRREQASLHLAAIEREIELRREAEEQLEFLVSTSPATIFTLDTSGRVLMANEAAHRLLGLAPGELQGCTITSFFPALTHVAPVTAGVPAMRTAMECHGRRQDGEIFLARIWFSTYRTVLGPRLAAVVFDASEDMRDREEFSLRQLLNGSRILVGAVCHEIRNICGAISVVYARLARSEGNGSEDLRAIGSLVEALGRMAGLELAHTARSEVQSTNLYSVLEDLRIVIEPAFRESGLTLRWDLPAGIPRVWADRQALLQAFLNLTQNSRRAIEESGGGELTIRVTVERPRVRIRILDTGKGVATPERLFKPFQEGAESSGLGLYLSRAFLRAFDGDLVYEPSATGCCFAVVLTVTPDDWPEAVDEHAHDPIAAA
jgi:PAS domain S-box-containing protein